jgi:4-hydroxy-tetrahydrodipicolinate synthase
MNVTRHGASTDVIQESAIKGAPRSLERGLWGVVATPFHGPDLELDVPSLRRLLAEYEAAGSEGLVLLGVFGEGRALSDAERSRIIEVAIEEVPSRRLVLGLSALDTETVVRDALALLPACAGHDPVFMVQVSTNDVDALIAHFTTIHTQTGAGILVQDYPLASGVVIGSAELAAVVNACPFVVGIKAEAPPTALAIGRLTVLTGVPVFGGLGGVGLLDELQAGAAGAMTGFSFPSALTQVLEASTSSGFEAARRAYLPWLPFVNFEAQAVVGLAIRKASLAARGIISEGKVRPPSAPLPDEMSSLLASQLAALQSAGVA